MKKILNIVWRKIDLFLPLFVLIFLSILVVFTTEFIYEIFSV